MSKNQTSGNGTMSDAIRTLLTRQPNAKVKDIKAKLDEQGIKASVALINKVKYGRGKAGGSKKRKGSRGAGKHGSKAEAIRQMIHTLGNSARNRDIVQALDKRGIKVSSAQVSNLRKSPTRGRGKASQPAVHAVAFEHLVLAKGLVDRLGSIERAREAINNLSRLLNA